MNAQALLGLVTYLTARPYIIILNPQDYLHKFVEIACKSGYFDPSTRREDLLRGWKGVMGVDRISDRVSPILTNKLVPEDVVVRMHPSTDTIFNDHYPELITLHATWPDIPDEILPLVYPKPRDRLSQRERDFIKACVDTPIYSHPKNIMAVKLLQRGLIEPIGTSFIATHKGRIAVGKYRSWWTRIGVWIDHEE